MRLKRICPHWFGWSYNTHRRRRWCRLCGQQQRIVRSCLLSGSHYLERWVDADYDDSLEPETLSRVVLEPDDEDAE